jgi:hypothetical protein
MIGLYLIFRLGWQNCQNRRAHGHIQWPGGGGSKFTENPGLAR